MPLSNVGTLVLNLIIFITTLVNFSYALTTLEPLALLVLYAMSKIFLTVPEAGIFSRCQWKDLYQDGGGPLNKANSESLSIRMDNLVPPP